MPAHKRIGARAGSNALSPEAAGCCLREAVFTLPIIAAKSTKRPPRKMPAAARLRRQATAKALIPSLPPPPKRNPNQRLPLRSETGSGPHELNSHPAARWARQRSRRAACGKKDEQVAARVLVGLGGVNVRV